MKKNKRRKIYWILIPSILLLLVLVGLLVKKTIEEDMTIEMQQESTAQLEIIMESETETESESEEIQTEENALQKDNYPEINQLMERFFQAKFDCNVEELSQIVNPIDGYTEERLYEDRYGKKENSLLEIESYQLDSCYTKEGLLEGTYIVWVYVEIKYINAETPAPALFRMYVCTDENGYYIHNGILEGELSTYRDEISAKADVLELVSMINQRYQEAVNHDEDLRNIVLSMEGE